METILINYLHRKKSGNSHYNFFSIFYTTIQFRAYINTEINAYFYIILSSS